MLIPTLKKEVLPRGFSYPAGAEQISRCLEGVPQYDLLRIAFWWRDQFWASAYAEKLKARGSIKILEVNHGLWPEWAIHVHAVPSEHKQHAGRRLADGLTGLKHRLMQAGRGADFFSEAISYDLASVRA